MDEKGRLFGRINIIDLAAILLVLLVAAGLFVKGRLPVVNSITSPPQKLQVTFLVSEVLPATADAVIVGGKAWEAKTGPYLGVITGKEAVPAVKWVKTADGRVAKTTVPEKVDIYITVTGEGRMDDTTTMLGSVEVRVGQTVFVKGADFGVESIVVSNREVK
jgi:hypothetical protein